MINKNVEHKSDKNSFDFYSFDTSVVSVLVKHEDKYFISSELPLHYLNKQLRAWNLGAYLV